MQEFTGNKAKIKLEEVHLKRALGKKVGHGHIDLFSFISLCHISFDCHWLRIAWIEIGIQHCIHVTCARMTFIRALEYFCHVLRSSLLTDPQQIYTNFFGHENKPGHILILCQVMTNKKYQSFVN